jgi:hypothetical protein
MVKDALIIVAIILGLLIIISIFGGCVSCSNNPFNEEGMTNVHPSAPFADSPELPMVAVPKASPMSASPPTQASTTIVSPPDGTIAGFDSAGESYAAFRSLP